MKKSALVSAVAAVTLCTSAHAARPVYAGLGTQMFIGTFPLLTDCPSGSTRFSIDGAAASQVQMLGNLCLDPSGTGTPFIRLKFNTVTGAYSAAGPNPGTTFTGGSIAIDVQTIDGFLPYGLVNVAINNIDCLANLTGHLGTNTTAGLQVASGTHPLPGVWDGVASSFHENDAACVVQLFSQTAALFLSGDMTAP